MRKDKSMVEAPKHARLSPSAAHRWLACPGSVRASGSAPDVPSIYAAEGTMLHTLTEIQLKTGAAPTIGSKHQIEGFDFEVTEEHVEAVQWCANHVHGLLEAIDDPDPQVHLEVRLNLAGIEEGMFGTSDIIIYSPKLRTLFVYDNKFGAGVKVDAEGNEQLICYAIGAYDWLSLVYDIRRITFGVLQPRLDHYDISELLVPDLEEWRERLKAGAKLTHRADAPLSAGDHCRFCPAKATCPALEARALAVVQEVFDDVNLEEIKPSDLDGARIARIMAQMPMIEAFCSSITTEARRRLEVGLGVPGWKLVNGRKQRTFAVEDAVKKWGKENRLNVYTIPEIVSPAVLEKLCKGAKVAFPKELVTETFGAPSLVPVSDSRPELSPAFEAVELHVALDALF